MALSPYPIPMGFIDSIGEGLGLDLEGDHKDVPARDLYRAKARVYFFLATTPNVSEGGVSISFNAEDKRLFLAMARRFANLAGEDGLIPGMAYGYKGENI